jgi:hypothetical protein
MMFELRRAAVVGIAVAVLSVAVPARAQEEVPPPPPQEPALTEEVVLEEEIPAEPAFVTFRDIRDAVPMKFFNADPTQTKPDLEDPNTLVIAFNTGIDPKTWSANDFRASTGAYGNRNVMDTLSFTVVAPEGHYVRSITYSQKGAGIVLRTGSAHGSSSWVIADRPSQLGFFGANPTLERTVEFTDPSWTEVPVSITTSLFAFSTPALGSATVALTSARVVVAVAPIPTSTPTP